MMFDDRKLITDVGSKYGSSDEIMMKITGFRRLGLKTK